MANLTLAFTTKELLNKIMSAQTIEWIEGLASIVVKVLQSNHKLTDVMSLAEERIALSVVK